MTRNRLFIRNWGIISTDSPYVAPECRRYRLRGQVFNHPLFDDGEVVVTSSIVKVGKCTVRTRSGSTYYLGKPSKEYEEMFPNARLRLLSLHKEAR